MTRSSILSNRAEIRRGYSACPDTAAFTSIEAGHAHTTNNSMQQWLTPKANVPTGGPMH